MAKKKKAAKKVAKKKKVKKKTAKKVAKKAAKKKAAPSSKNKKKTASSKKTKKKKVVKKATTRKKVAKKKAVKKVTKKKKVVKKAVAAKPKAKAKKTAPQPSEPEVIEEENFDDVELEVSDKLSDEKEDEIILTDAEGRRYCRVRDCDQISIVDGYCRYHYLLFWKKIQVRKKILTEGKLQKYIEDLTARYPDKFLEILRKDLRSEKDFLAAIMELELDESPNEDSNYEEDDRSFIDEVRGVTDSARSSRDEDDY